MPLSSKTIYEKIKNTLIPLYGEQEAEVQTFWLMEEWFELSKSEVLARKPITFSEKEVKHLLEGLNRLKKHEPIQQVLEKGYFLDRPFYVNRYVLIPRQETEELIHWIKENHQREGMTLLDIGTGSGCIAISLALELETPRIYAWEVSPGAIRVARRNAETLQAKVEFERVDVLNPGTPSIKEKMDIIVSNPPYVTDSEKFRMNKNVLDYEPAIALFVPTEDPLLFYRRIAELATRFLKPEGWIYLEINEKFGQDTADLLKFYGFKDIEIKQDLNGKDRFVRGRI